MDSGAPRNGRRLMLGVLHVLVTEGLIDRPFIARMSVGFDRLECHVLGQDGTPPRRPRGPRRSVVSPPTRSSTWHGATLPPARLR